MDLVKQSIGKEVYVKCKYDRELKGKLHVRNNFFLIKIITIVIRYSFKYIAFGC